MQRVSGSGMFFCKRLKRFAIFAKFLKDTCANGAELLFGRSALVHSSKYVQNRFVPTRFASSLATEFQCLRRPLSLYTKLQLDAAAAAAAAASRFFSFYQLHYSDKQSSILTFVKRFVFLWIT